MRVCCPHGQIEEGIKDLFKKIVVDPVDPVDGKRESVDRIWTTHLCALSRACPHGPRKGVSAGRDATRPQVHRISRYPQIGAANYRISYRDL